MSGHIADAGALDWTTPVKVVDFVTTCLGGIDLDPCSNENSRVGALVNYLLPEHEGLKETWQPDLPGGGKAQSAFINPPFGRCYRHCETKEVLTPKAFKALREQYIDLLPPVEAKAELAKWSVSSIADWWRRASIEAPKMDRGIIFLGPNAQSSRYWKRLVWGRASSILVPLGRLKFGTDGRKKSTSAPMDCAIVLFSQNDDVRRRFLQHGPELGTVIDGWTR